MGPSRGQDRAPGGRIERPAPARKGGKARPIPFAQNFLPRWGRCRAPARFARHLPCVRSTQGRDGGGPPRPTSSGTPANGGRKITTGVLALVSFLLPTPALAAADDPLPPDIVFMLIVVASTALALAGGAWALAEYRGTRALRRLLAATVAKARAMIVARDALITAGRESVIVWGAGLADPISFGGGAQTIEACLTGPDATPLAMALDILAEQGVPFTIKARTRDGRVINVRGRPAGGFAAVYLEAESEAATGEPDYRALLDALPVPAWLRARDLALRWANRAFLAATGAASLDAAIAENAALDRSERDLASAARGEGHAVEAKRYAVVAGQRRALSFTLTPLADGSVAGAAVDVTSTAEAEARLQQHIDAHADTLDRLSGAVAIFGADQKLAFFNRAYVRLWELPETWLEAHPSEGDILDRLREARRLPEQRDFRAWKQEHLKLFERAERHPEELWHLPGGKTLRVAAQPHPFGGLIFLYEDVSDQLRLESQYNTLIKVQKATLDTLQEGVAVFGPDGRLKLYNAAFAHIWRLEPDELHNEPHLNRIVDSATARFGRDRSWEIVAAGVTSQAPERRREWDRVERSDGAIISLALAPLPDGATLASFADVTDRSRIETALRERNEALEAADKLKSEFVKRVSYELRTPLNSILGFAELLKAGTPGPLNVKQNEYIDAVVTASSSLRDLINDILDLSQIEAGAMELDLEKLDLHALLANVADHFREWAAKMDLMLVLECRADVGTFVADGRRLKQILFNLLSNAFKHTPRGGTITLAGDIAGDDVRIAVSDTGPGVAPEIMPSAFERFSAKGSAAARGGAGLGLALVNRFIELHDGWVELKSAPGQGTTVTCHLPRRADAHPTPRDTAARA
jgi:signal transduction histidine kinase